MKYFRQSITSILLASTSILFFECCKKDDPTTTTSPTSYDRANLLTNLANNYILPAYGEYKAQATNLKEGVIAFNDAPSVSQLQTLRTQWENALLVWQDVAFLEIGPASTISLRSQTNVYPVDTALINNNIASGTYDLELPSNFDAKGFQAVDYLINGKGTTDQETVDYYTNSTSARTYLLEVATEMENNAISVSTNWQNDYVASFIANSASNAQGSSVSNIVNAFVEHYEAFVRKGKIGLPAGVFNGFSQEPLPSHVEALYYQQSLPFVHRSLTAIQKFIQGESYIAGADGEGLDDYMRFVRAKTSGQPLEMVIYDQISLIKTELTTINDPLSLEVASNNSAVRAVYEEMQKLVPYLKVDMTNALDVLVTYQDNDGD